MKTVFSLTFIGLLLSVSVAVAAAEHAGIVKSTVGEVVVVRGDRSISAQPNLKLFEGDLVRTGPTGKAGLILEDDTVISMGNNSSICLKSFLFQPNEKKLSLIAQIIHGTISYLSGQIAKLAPNAVRLETPRATVGVRGTHVLIEVD